MIFSKFGSKLTPISKRQDSGDQILIQAQVEGTPEVREYALTDLKADDGLSEIDQMIAALPWKAEHKTKRGPERRC